MTTHTAPRESSHGTGVSSVLAESHPSASRHAGHVVRAPARYVIVKGKGGMGNRLLCALTGIAWGRLADRRVVIDWSDQVYSDDGRNVFPLYFSCPHVVSSAHLPDSTSIRPLRWAGQLDRSLTHMISTYDPRSHSSLRINRKYSIDPHYLDYDEELVVYWSYTERAAALRKALRRRPDLGWPSEPVPLLRTMLRHDLRMNPAVLERADAFVREQFGQGPVIGVHIRYTDRTMNLEHCLAHVRRLAAETPSARIFLATDSRACLERLAREFPQLCATPKWYPPASATMHQSDTCPNRFENGIEALVDMVLLSRCDWLIYPSRSTFSWVAALMSDADPAQIIDLDRRNLMIYAKRLIRRWLE